MEDLEVAVRDLQEDARRLQAALTQHTRTMSRQVAILTVLLILFATAGMWGAYELHQQATQHRTVVSTQSSGIDNVGGT